MILTFLLPPLCLAAAIFIFALLRAVVAQSIRSPRLEAVFLGAITNFFDTLGIGSFAPTIVWMRLRRLVPDRLIAASNMAGHSLPTIAQSAIFLVLLGVKVDPILLVGCIVAMVAGGHVGMPIVRHAPVKLVQSVVVVALLIAATFYSLANLNLMPGGGHATSLPPVLMAVAIGMHFMLGILLNFGVGSYAPTLVMLSVFGMDSRLAFPIMASAGAFCFGTAGIRLVQKGELDLRIILGMAVGGVPAVLVAAFVVRDMPIVLLRWMVVGVVIYAALTLLRSVIWEKPQSSDGTARRQPQTAGVTAVD